ncbi:MAG: acylglycerol kinase family protein, partial [Gaiellaceae bacterium]
MRKRAALIVNPYSTHVTGDRITEVERALREHVELQTTFTQRPGHATELAAEFARAADAILVFSGDGTYNEALNGATDGGVPFGFLPGGGTSVLPRA